MSQDILHVNTYGPKVLRTELLVTVCSYTSEFSYRLLILWNDEAWNKVCIPIRWFKFFE